MFLSRNKKKNGHPCKPQFYYIKVGFKGVKIIKVRFRDEFLENSSDSSKIQIFRDISGKPFYFIMKLYAGVLIRIAFIRTYIFA